MSRTRVILYVRVSTDKQDMSQEIQIEKLRMHASIFDLKIIEEIIDEAKSGKSLDRPGIQRALTLLSAGEANCLVVLKLDRLTRDLGDFQYLLKNYFKEGGIADLRSVLDSIDTSTANGRLALNIQMAVFQWEREKIVEMVTGGLHHRRDTGKVYCKRVYGYAPHPDDLRARQESADRKVSVRLIPVPEEQEVIARIQELSRFNSASEIARLLTQDHIPSPTGRSVWRHGTVKDILNRCSA